MKKNDVFTFTAPNGAEVTGVVIYRRKLQNFVNYVQYEYVAYAQNRLFTCTQMERVIDRENYNACPIEYGHVLVDYAILPDYDAMLDRYNDIEVAQAETQSGM
jgi:hypothetical protein